MFWWPIDIVLIHYLASYNEDIPIAMFDSPIKPS